MSESNANNSDANTNTAGESTQTGQQAGNSANSANANNNAGTNANAENNGGEDSGTFTQADVDRITAKVRKEEKARLQKQIDDANKSELEKAQARINELETENRRAASLATFETAARAANCTNPQAAFQLVAGSIEYDAQGKISNLKNVIAEAKAIVPQLFGAAGSANGGDGGGGGGKFNMNDWIRNRGRS